MSIIINAVFLLSFLIFSYSAHAASVYFSSNLPTVSVGDVFIVEAKISSFAERVNVADGGFIFDADKLEIKELSTGGSAFALWAQEPKFSNLTGEVNFVGGAPEGFQADAGGIIKTVFIARKAGEARLSFGDGFLLFLSDGKGTSIRPERASLTIPILQKQVGIAPKDEWQTFLGKDTTPPELFDALIAKEPTLFDNRYFVTFFTTDKDSGIARYEVKEGERDFIGATSPYVLQDQSLVGGIQVRAVDKAGNKRIVVVTAAPSLPSASYPRGKYVIFALVALLALTLFIFLRAIYNKSK